MLQNKMIHFTIAVSGLLAWSASGITLIHSETWRRRRTTSMSKAFKPEKQLDELVHSDSHHGVASLIQSSSNNSQHDKLLSYVSSILSNKKSGRQGNAMFFDITKCLIDTASGKLGSLAFQAVQACSHTFSCVGSFNIDNSLSIILGMFCALNAYEQNTPPDVAKPMDLGYVSFLNSIFIPLWQVLYDMASMIPTGKSFVQQDDDCSAYQSGFKKLECMMTHTRMFAQFIGGKPDFLNFKLSKAQEELIGSKLKGVHSSFQLLQTGGQVAAAKRQELEQGQGAGPVKGSKLYNSPADDVPMPGPLNTSIINPPSKSRFSHVATGLPMKAQKMTEVIPEAKCGDGSSGLMYLAEGTETGKFHFHVAGGYFCNSPRVCRKRVRGSPMLASTKGYESQYDGTGVFHPTMGGLPGWTHAYAVYCSSDAWFGQVDLEFQVVSGTYISEGVGGTHFRGLTMLDAMLKKYVMMGLGSGSGHELVISSCSAGAIGVAAQADSFAARVEKLYRETYPAGTSFYRPKIVTVLDNMPIVSPTPRSINFNGNMSLFEQSQLLVDMLYVKPGLLSLTSDFLNSNCVAKYKDNPAACVFPGIVMPFIQVPNLVLNNLQDSFLLFNPHAFMKPSNPEQEGWMYDLEADMRAAIKEVTPQQNQWAISCNDHCLMIMALWWRWKPPSAPGGFHDTSAKDMMLMTMEGDTGHIAMDDCSSFNCGCAGFGPFYYMEMVGQYCMQRSYNMLPQAYASAAATYDAVLRLPKDPDNPPEAEEEAGMDPPPAAVGDICLAYAQVAAYQGMYMVSQSLALTAEIGTKP